MEYGILSLTPALVAIILAFVTKDAIVALLTGVACGILVSSQGLITGFTGITQTALGTPDFIWVLSIELFIGIMIAFFQKSGAIQAFTEYIQRFNLKAKGAQVLSWLLGIFIFFSDYFSPLYVGTVMRDITDKARVSREKLAYICDSTSAPVTSIIPFSSWGVYMAGLLVGIGAFTSREIAMDAVIKMVPFNFYGLFSVIMVGLIAFGIIPDFGPMKEAEKRARETGKVVADGSRPLLGKELTEIQPNEGVKPNLFLNFFMPAFLIIGVTVGTYIFTGVAKTLEGFVVAVLYQFIFMFIQKMGTLSELIETGIEGIKGVLSAIIILGLAYSLNEISSQLGTAEYVISVTEQWMTPSLLLVFTFLVCAFISFFTGTSWGTYAIVTPMVIPIAFTITGGEITPLIYATVGAIMGGGVFGDHCSPLSDTTILSSLAAGSDHIDHVRTQIPYALSVAGVSTVLYFIVGSFI